MSTADELHRGGQHLIGTVHDEVVVVVHQAVRNDRDAEALARLADELAEMDSISIVEEDPLSVDAAIDDVMAGSGKIDPA